MLCACTINKAIKWGSLVWNTMLLDILWHSLSYTCTIRSKYSFHFKQTRKEEPGSETNDLWWIYGLFLSLKYTHEAEFVFPNIFTSWLRNYFSMCLTQLSRFNMHNSYSFDNALSSFILKLWWLWDVRWDGSSIRGWRLCWKYLFKVF